MSEETVQQAEERLLKAQLASDVEELDRLIADDLVFTTHAGQVVGKQDDLKIHRSGTLKFSKVNLTEQVIREHGNSAVAVDAVDLAGIQNGEAFSGLFRFTRFWIKFEDGCWRIVGGHVSQVEPVAGE